MTLSSPPSLLISASASVLLNYKLHPSLNLCVLFVQPVYPSHTRQCCFVNSIFVYKFVILYLINIWCLSALFSLCCLTLASPQLHIIFGFVCALLCQVFCFVYSLQPQPIHLLVLPVFIWVFPPCRIYFTWGFPWSVQGQHRPKSVVTCDSRFWLPALFSLQCQFFFLYAVRL